MNAEVLIKARKVFLKDTIVEYSETCPHCASKGLDSKLRYYFISLEEAIYKCAHPTCLYPFQRFIFKSLIDNSVYYYEEVIDGGREAYLRVPLDGQKLFDSPNALSTLEFCDSQRNPNIESYDCDFAEFLNDFEPELQSEPKSETTTQQSNVDPDLMEFLESLDETAPKTDDQNIDKLLDVNGIDNLIGIFNESPAKSSASSVEASSPVKTETKVKGGAKLSKSIQIIESVKRSKGQRRRAKPDETFTMAIEKARKTQAKAKITSTALSPMKREAEILEKPTTQSTQRSILQSALKTTKNLRPSQLAKELSSWDLTKINTNSRFLQQYMKVKEKKMCEGESSSSTVDNESEAMKSLKVMNRPLALKQNATTTDDQSEQAKESAPVAVEPAKPKKQIVRTIIVKASDLKRLTDEPKQEQKQEIVVKKVRKPAVRKPKPSDKDVAEIRNEPDDTNLITVHLMAQQSTINRDVKIKEENPVPKRKTARKKKNTEPTLIDDNYHSKMEESDKPKPKRIRKKTSSKANDDLASVGDAKIDKVSAKRQQKRKVNAELSNSENEKAKSKRRRTTKPTVNSRKAESTSLPQVPLNKTESEKTLEVEPISTSDGNTESIDSASVNENVKPERGHTTKPIVNSSNAESASLPQVPLNDTEAGKTLEVEPISTYDSDAESIDGASANERDNSTVPSASIEIASSSSESNSEGSCSPLLGFTPEQTTDSKAERNSILDGIKSLGMPSQNTMDDTPPEKSIGDERSRKAQSTETKNVQMNSEDDSNASEASQQMMKPRQEATKEIQLGKATKPLENSSRKSNVQVHSNQPDELSKTMPQHLAGADQILHVEVNVDNVHSLEHEERTDGDPSEATEMVAENYQIKKPDNSEPYYRRKNFDKEKKDYRYGIDDVMDDWKDGDSEQEDLQQVPGKIYTRQESTSSVITIASETSESGNNKTPSPKPNI